MTAQGALWSVVVFAVFGGAIGLAWLLVWLEVRAGDRVWLETRNGDRR